MLRYRCTHMIYGLVGKLIEYIDLLSFLNTDIDLLRRISNFNIQFPISCKRYTSKPCKR